MTPEELAELARLEKAATPGPWFNPSECVIISCDRPDAVQENGYICPEVEDPEKPDEWSERRRINADLICAMRNALPALLARIAELEAKAQR